MTFLPQAWQTRLHEIIFEAETPAGKAFDVILIISILLSVVAVMLGSVEAIQNVYGELLYAVEWVFTILFSLEYLLRLFCIGRPVQYARSFFGIVDLLSILPTYLAIIFPAAQSLLVIRILRVLRVFRILKLVQYLGEANYLAEALRASTRKIIVFLLTVMTLVIISGALLYLAEGGENGFTSIPRSVYWAIVTLTTVGYGDISPQTPLGQAMASVIMILGYSILAVPTGIVTVEMSRSFKPSSCRVCPQCAREGHDRDAAHCKYCGGKL